MAPPRSRVRIKGPGSVIFGKADAGYDTETEALA